MRSPMQRLLGWTCSYLASTGASRWQSTVSADVCLAKSMDHFEWVIIFPDHSAHVLSEAGPGHIQRLAYTYTVNLAGVRLAPILSHLLRARAHIHAHACIPHARGRLLKTLYHIFGARRKERRTQSQCIFCVVVCVCKFRGLYNPRCILLGNRFCWGWVCPPALTRPLLQGYGFVVALLHGFATTVSLWVEVFATPL